MSKSNKLKILEEIDVSRYGSRGEAAKEMLRKIWSMKVSASMSGAEYYAEEIADIISRVSAVEAGREQGG